MKKKLFVIITTFICLLVLSGCGCDHEWVDATRTEAKTCVICGTSEGDPLSLDEAYPKGTPRHEDGAFLMNIDDFIALYLEDLKANGYSFYLENSSGEAYDYGTKYFLYDDHDHYISIVPVYDSKGRITSLLAGCPYYLDDMDLTNQMLEALYIMFETCSADSSDAFWEVFESTMEYSYAEGSIISKSIYNELTFITFTLTDHFEVSIFADPNNPFC